MTSLDRNYFVFWYVTVGAGWFCVLEIATVARSTGSIILSGPPCRSTIERQQSGTPSVSLVILAHISYPEYAVDSVFVCRPRYTVQNYYCKPATLVALAGLEARRAS